MKNDTYNRFNYGYGEEYEDRQEELAELRAEYLRQQKLKEQQDTTVITE